MMPKALALPTRYGKTLIPDLIVHGGRPWWRRYGRLPVPIPANDEA
jgi:hypothetical protein